MRPQFEDLLDKLLRAGVAPRHVNRYLHELSEHLDDLIAAEERRGQSHELAEKLALARLGETDLLVNVMIAKKGFRSWTHRAPWVVFLLAPLLAVICAQIVTMLLLLFPMERRDLAINHGYSLVPNWFGLFVALIAGFNEFVLPQLLGWGITTVAVKQRMRPVWPILGVLTTAILCGSQSYHVNWLHAPNQSLGVTLNMPFLRPVEPLAVVSAAIRVLLNFVVVVVLYTMWSRRRLPAQRVG